MCCVSLLGSLSLDVTLLADVSNPVFQEDLISNWEPAHGLVEDAVSGAKIDPCLMASGCHPPASLPQAGMS